MNKSDIKVKAELLVIESEDSNSVILSELQIPDPDEETAKARLDANS